MKATPLVLIACGLSVCYLSNNWNIGAEGQFVAGALAGSILPVMFPHLQGFYTLPLMLLCGALGGAAYAMIPAILKTRFSIAMTRVSKVLTCSIPPARFRSMSAMVISPRTLPAAQLATTAQAA